MSSNEVWRILDRSRIRTYQAFWNDKLQSVHLQIAIAGSLTQPNTVIATYMTLYTRLSNSSVR